MHAKRKNIGAIAFFVSVSIITLVRASEALAATELNHMPGKDIATLWRWLHEIHAAATK